MGNFNSEIRTFIEEKIDAGYKKFIIFPFGDIGVKVKYILNNVYGITEEYILDNHLFMYNQDIKPIAYMKDIEHKECALLLSSTNPDIYDELKSNALLYFSMESIAELSSMQKRDKNIREKNKKADLFKFYTKKGRYSYGPLCNDSPLIESIGSFCSFAAGTCVVQNHEIRFLTTHPMLYAGKIYEDRVIDYTIYEDESWYIEGVEPHEDCFKIKRSRIGNDVWLGRNVIIANGADIGNGVIAGAGAVITKDVPDYAIVVGVPARIIKYRYTQEQIASLNKICWWDWSDEKIRECYDDFYLPIDEFIKKHGEI